MSDLTKLHLSQPSLCLYKGHISLMFILRSHLFSTIGERERLLFLSRTRLQRMLILTVFRLKNSTILTILTIHKSHTSTITLSKCQNRMTLSSYLPKANPNMRSNYLTQELKLKRSLRRQRILLEDVRRVCETRHILLNLSSIE